VDLVLPEEGLVVQSIEITSLTLVWSLRRVAHEIAVVVVPAVLVVPVSSFLRVEHVKEHVVLLWAVSQIIESLDRLWSVVKTSCENQSLVGVLLTV